MAHFSTNSEITPEKVEEISWGLIGAYFEEKGYVRTQINSYNDLIYKWIPEIIQRLGIFTFSHNSHTYSYTFKKTMFGLPYYQEPEGKFHFFLIFFTYFFYRIFFLKVKSGT
jgi:DNA-directed RNA polymerase beta subunit